MLLRLCRLRSSGTRAATWRRGCQPLLPRYPRRSVVCFSVFVPVWSLDVMSELCLLSLLNFTRMSRPVQHFYV